MYLGIADCGCGCGGACVQAEPLRIVNLSGGLGFSAALAPIAAGGGPAGLIVAGIAAALPLLISGIKALFHAGHADDATDRAEHMIAKQMLAPIMSEILQRQVVGFWNETNGEGGQSDIDPSTDDVAHLEENHAWPLTAARTAELINFGDQTMQQACAQYAAAGYPCGAPVPGKSPAGTWAIAKWNRLKGYMQIGLQQAQQREAAGTTPTTDAAGGAGAIASIVPASVSNWFSGDTSFGSVKVPNAMLAAGAGLAIAWAASKE